MFIDGKKVGKLEIVKYDIQFVEGKPKLIISMIKALDVNGNYIKFASMKETLPLLSQVEVTFKNKDAEQLEMF